MKTMVRWDPFRELDLMERSMRRFGMPLLPIAALPAADIYETEDEYVVELEVPGYAEKELTIEVSDHMLTVKGEHEATTDKKEKTYVCTSGWSRSSSASSSFRRSSTPTS